MIFSYKNHDWYYKLFIGIEKPMCQLGILILVEWLGYWNQNAAQFNPFKGYFFFKVIMEQLFWCYVIH